MANVRIKLTLDAGEVRKLVSAPDRPVQRLVLRLQRAVANSAKQRAPVDTGNLRNSIAISTVRSAGGKVSALVEATADYASYVHDGTRPHVIRPKNATVLRFPGRGGVTFAKSVNHPGTKARPFLRNALEGEAPRLGFRLE